MPVVEVGTENNWTIRPTPVAVPPPDAGVAAGGGGGGGGGVGAGYPPTDAQFASWILNSPRYKQGLEDLGSYDTAISRIKELAALSSGYSSGGGYTPQTVPKSFYEQIKLAEEKATHDFQNLQKALPEMMAARGMLSSGQTGFEQNEAKYAYDTTMKDIALQKKAREEAVAEANRAAANAAAAAAHNAAISRAISAKQDEYKIIDLGLEKAKAQGTLANDVYAYYKDLWWDGSTYTGPRFDSAGNPIQ